MQGNQQKFPRGWDEERVRKVLAHYENQTEDEALAEDEVTVISVWSCGSE